jgi:hypothetical protein
MASRSLTAGALGLTAVLGVLTLRATTLHSVSGPPLIYKAVANVNDLDIVEGIAPPNKWVELWVRQRNFKEGNLGDDPFAWCSWKNGGNAVRLGATWSDATGRWRVAGLRAGGNTVMLFPAAPGGDRCLGGIYTELLPRACDAPGVGCSTMLAPTLHWLNVRRPTSRVGTTAGSVSWAEQASATVADGPDDGPEASSVYDGDQNGIDTTAPGYTVGQRITWKCDAGGTAVCPSVTIHDATTAISADPEYPFVLGTIQAHRHGGSFVAAAAIARGQPIGFAVDVNVRFRGRLDINLGCDQRKFFDFSVPLQF